MVLATSPESRKPQGKAGQGEFTSAYLVQLKIETDGTKLGCVLLGD